MFTKNTPVNQMVISNYNELLAALCTCITPEGINSERRREIVQYVVNKNGGRFPEWVPVVDAGNITFTLMNEKNNKTDKEQSLLLNYFDLPNFGSLQNLCVLQTKRYSPDGQVLMGRGLLGGMTNQSGGKGHRDEAACAASIAKLRLFGGASNHPFTSRLEPSTDAFSGIRKLNAYSVHDVGFMINYFAPTADYIKGLLEKRLIDVETCNNNLMYLDKTKKMSHLQKDSTTLKLAISNSYRIHLGEFSASLFEQECYQRPETKSNPLNHVVYQLDVRPILLCLFPQDYLYRHEFYFGIMKTLVSNLQEKVTQGDPLQTLGSVIELATANIINRMIQDITAKHFPKQLEGLVDENQIYLTWKSMVEINFKQFVRDYAGIGWDTLIGSFGLGIPAFTNLDERMHNIWKQRENEVKLALRQTLARQGQSDHAPIPAGFEYNDQIGMYYNPLNGDVLEASVSSSSDGQIMYDASLISGVPIRSFSSPESDSVMPSAGNAWVASKQVIDDMVQDPITMDFPLDMVMGEDLYLYGSGTYDQLTASPFARETFLDKGFYLPRILNKFIGTYHRNHISAQENRIVDAEEKRTLLQLCMDPFTKKLMDDPVIVLFESRNTHSRNTHSRNVVICDRQSIDPYVRGSYTVVKSREFDSLKDVIGVLRADLERWYANPSIEVPRTPQESSFLVTEVYQSEYFGRRASRHAPQPTNPAPSSSSSSAYAAPDGYRYGQVPNLAPQYPFAFPPNVSSAQRVYTVSTPQGTETRTGQ